MKKEDVVGIVVKNETGIWNTFYLPDGSDMFKIIDDTLEQAPESVSEALNQLKKLIG